jgi:hypothetical protein
MVTVGLLETTETSTVNNLFATGVNAGDVTLVLPVPFVSPGAGVVASIAIAIDY